CVKEREEENAFILELTVAPDDMGKVIGKQGRIARAIRTVVKAATTKSAKKYIVEII
ncbi:MAG: KH domain-containing protein, partial [Christensenella sp.]